MSLVRWSQSRDLPTFPSDVLNIQREINRMFDSFFRSGWSEDASLSSAVWSPATDITEDDHGYLVKVELPGVKKDEVKITMENSVLTIHGEKKQEKRSKSDNAHRVERIYGSFQRSFTLPTSVKPEEIEATFTDGILTISLPKVEEARPKQIDVKVK